MNAQQIEQTAADWLTRRIGDSWSSADQAGLDAWLNEHLAHRIAYVRVESVWNQVGRLQAIGAGVARGTPPPRGVPVRWVPAASESAVDPSSSPVFPSAQPVARARRRVMSIASMAAAGVLVAIAGGWLYLGSAFTEDRYTTKVGGMDVVALADGSSVILNTDSRIRVAIKSQERRIDLDQGEAFFTVAKDPVRPFIVDIGDRRVVAVGTQFSVRRVSGDIRVTVTEGAVRLENANSEKGDSDLSSDSSAASSKSYQADPDSLSPSAAGSRGLLLRAGSVARIRANTVSVERRPVSQAEELLSWRQGHLVFRDATLADAVAEFNRYNTRKIVIADASIAAIHIGGNFRATSTEVFLWMLQNGFPVTVEESGREVILRRR